MAETVFGGELASTRFAIGTPAWYDALNSDLSSGYLTRAQYEYAVANPGMAIPLNPPTVSQESSWTSFWSGISNTANIVFGAIAKRDTMDYQRDLLQSDIERRRLQIESGLPAPSGYGGINVYTLAALAGVALLAILILKQSK